MSCRDDSCALMLDAKEVPRSTDTRVQVESISVEELSGKGNKIQRETSSRDHLPCALFAEMLYVDYALFGINV